MSPDKSYRHDEEFLLIVLDWRVPDTAGILHRELRAWRGCATVETIDDNHCVLIVRPGLAKWIAAQELTNRKDTDR